MSAGTLAMISKKSMFMFCLVCGGIVFAPQAFNWFVTVDGGYTQWTKWGLCSQTCGVRVQGRLRNCTNPKPRGNGKSCDAIGPRSVVQNCLFINCPINGNWGSWGEWAKCEPNCKTGMKKRVLRCDNPKPQHGGSHCIGIATKEVAKCDNLPACPINGGLSVWAAWSTCSAPCGDGEEKRTRQCNNPAPKFNGKPCADPLEEKKKCKLKDCPATTAGPTTAAPPPPSKISIEFPR